MKSFVSFEIARLPLRLAGDEYTKKVIKFISQNLTLHNAQKQ